MQLQRSTVLLQSHIHVPNFETIDDVETGDNMCLHVDSRSILGLARSAELGGKSLMIVRLRVDWLENEIAVEYEFGIAGPIGCHPRKSGRKLNADPDLGQNRGLSVRTRRAAVETVLHSGCE